MDVVAHCVWLLGNKTGRAFSLFWWCGKSVPSLLLCDRPVRYGERSGHPRLQGIIRPESSVLMETGSIPLAWRRWSKPRSCVGKRGRFCILEHVMVQQMSVISEKEFYLSYVVCNVLTSLFFWFVCWQLTDLLSEIGAALRINTDTLFSHTKYLHTHTHTRCLICLWVFSSSMRSSSSQADGEHLEWKQIRGPVGSPSIWRYLGLPCMGLRFLITDWLSLPCSPTRPQSLPSLHSAFTSTFTHTNAEAEGRLQTVAHY